MLFYPAPAEDWPATRQFRFIKPVERTLVFLFCRYHVVGRENIPAEPPYVVTSNHMSYWEVPLLHYPFPDNTVGMAARKYRKPVWRPIFAMYPLIWVTQFSADRGALRSAVKVLENGRSIAIAPEGTRSKTGALIQGTSGAAFLANRANVPILPAVAWGQEMIGRRLRPKVTVRIGKPYRLPEGRAKGDQLEAYAERIMCAMAALMPEKYHGVYAGNPLIDEMREIVT